MRAISPSAITYRGCCVRGGRGLSPRKDFDEPNDRSERRGGLEADRSHDPFEYIRLDSGDICLQLGPQSGNICLQFGPQFGDICFQFGPEFRNICLQLGPQFGNICLQLGLDSRQIRVDHRQIRLCGEILMRRLAQGFGEGVRLLGRKPPFLLQVAREAEGIEENCGHGRSMGCGKPKVHQRRAAAALSLTKSLGQISARASWTSSGPET